jgi:hypothetical protein
VTDHPRHHHHGHHHHDQHQVGRGAAVLDIGGDVGALLARMDPKAAGTELHLRSEHEPPISVHTGVWERSQGSAMVTVALFPELLAGTYWVLDGNGAAMRRVEITGGKLASLDLRSTQG